VLKMATIEGAKAIGLDKKIGSIETGKLADLIVIDTNSPHLVPMYDPVSHIVYTIRGSDVRDVFIGRHCRGNEKSFLVRKDNLFNDSRLMISQKVTNSAIDG